MCINLREVSEFSLRLEAEVYKPINREAAFVGLVEGVPISSFGGGDGEEWGPGMFRVIFS